MEFNTIFDKNTAIHTPLLDNALALIDKVHSCYGDIVLVDKENVRSYWHRYGDQTCYRFTPSIDQHTGTITAVYCNYCKKEWYDKRQYRVLEFDEVFEVDLGEFNVGFNDVKAAIAALF